MKHRPYEKGFRTFLFVPGGIGRENEGNIDLMKKGLGRRHPRAARCKRSREGNIDLMKKGLGPLRFVLKFVETRLTEGNIDLMKKGLGRPEPQRHRLRPRLAEGNIDLIKKGLGRPRPIGIHSRRLLSRET